MRMYITPSKRNQRRWQIYNSPRRTRRSIKDKDYLRQKQRDLIILKETRGCAICDMKDAACLEFHHLIPEEKKFNVDLAAVKARSAQEIQKEMAKCVILCANCHRRVHAGTIVVLSFRPLILQPA